MSKSRTSNPATLTASRYAKHASAAFAVAIDHKAITRACDKGLAGAKRAKSGWAIDPAQADADLLKHLPRLRKDAASPRRQTRKAKRSARRQASKGEAVDPLIAYLSEAPMPATLHPSMDLRWHVNMLAAVAKSMRQQFLERPNDAAIRVARRRAIRVWLDLDSYFARMLCIDAHDREP